MIAGYDQNVSVQLEIEAFRKQLLDLHYQNGTDHRIKKALKWIDIAFKDSDDLKYWQLRYKAIIYERAGKVKKAKKYAKMGYDLALKNNIPDGINTLKVIYERLND